MNDLLIVTVAARNRARPRKASAQCELPYPEIIECPNVLPYHYLAWKTTLRMSMPRLTRAVEAEDMEDAIFNTLPGELKDAHMDTQQWADLKLLKEAMGRYARMDRDDRQAVDAQYRAWMEEA